MMYFLNAHGWEIGRLTFEHLWLTLSAMLLAAGIGLPLGILLSRQRRLAGAVVGFADVVEAGARLGLFWVLLPGRGLGGDGGPVGVLGVVGCGAVAGLGG